MGWLAIVAFFMIAVPIGRAIATRIERGGQPREEKEIRKALLLAEQRLADSEARLAALEERADFYEKLLSKGSTSSPS